MSAVTKQREAAKQLYRRISPWQTRILRLEPAPHHEQPVFCRLQAANITAWEGLGIVDDGKEKEIPFEALSYEWGTPDFTQTLTVNGLEYPVTQNLFSALQHLRDDNRPRYLWVDALCTNQHDAIEKAIQVRRMFVIYRKAERVIAWVPGWSEGMISTLRSLLAEPTSAGHMDGRRQEETYKLLVDAYHPSLLRRTWIRQEFFAANVIMFQYGNLSLSWDQYSQLGDIIETVRASDPIPRKEEEEIWHTDANSLRFPDVAAESLVPLMQERCAVRPARINPWSPSNAVSLLGALVLSSQFQVTDERDLIYGVIGLTNIATKLTLEESDGEIPKLPVDYSISVSEVYQNTTIFLIQSARSLAILDFAGWADGQDMPPSWAPDWRRFKSEVAESRVSRQTDSWKYGTIDLKQLDEKMSRWQPQPKLLKAPGVLSTRGLVLANVGPTDVDGYTWSPFVSPKLVESVLAKFASVDHSSRPERLREFTSMFPDIGTGHQKRFFDMFESEEWELPLIDGTIRSVQVTESGLQVFTQLQEEIFEGWFAEYTRYGQPFPGFPAEPLWLPTVSVATVPHSTMQRDLIVLLSGAPYPFVMRPTDGGKYHLVGRSLYSLWFDHIPARSAMPCRVPMSDFASFAWSRVIETLNSSSQLGEFDII
ncbi:uncharacterized protein JN550_006478 [Neoarthrinium moseri]|uniref:uncharacterized protein n=1 Tax=Neoarthrinium moseri TaxID=1658444 RepID=UPI001FDDFED1|nr:uncharacterized protein JN550_006478 [Neoarthrinium moseri]KAI1868562.1 hypothetical protein JN550_006478 [Neoarthrinium moseri]